MTDQLAGVRRILDEIIAPELREGYPSQILRGIIKNLEMLEGAWGCIVPFLEWDNDATASLLEDSAPLVSGDLREEIRVALGQGTSARSPEDLEAHNTCLRGLLAAAIPHMAGREDSFEVLRRIRDHLVERTSRYPFRMAIASPTRAKS